MSSIQIMRWASAGFAITALAQVVIGRDGIAILSALAAAGGFVWAATKAAKANREGE